MIIIIEEKYSLQQLESNKAGSGKYSRSPEQGEILCIIMH